VFANFLVYFSKWLVVDAGVPDIWYNAVFVVVALMLLFSAPALAAHTDRCGHRKLFLDIATAGTVLAYLAAALFAIYGAPVILAFLALILGQYMFQMSYIFYDPMINDLSDQRHRSRASGIGQFCSNAGMIFGLAISLPMVEAGGRLAPLVPSVILFAILAAPMIIFYKEGYSTTPSLRATPSPAKGTSVRLGFDWKKFKNFVLTSAAAPILIAFFFYTNALNTITNNYAIYADRVLGMPDEMASIILIVVKIAAALGALCIGFLGDRLGARKCLFYILWAWLLLIPVIAAANSLPLFFALASVLGLTIGAGWAISRAYISMNLGKDQVGYGFSFYTIFERFSSMAGPLVWGTILTVGLGYRASMLSMAVFILIGMVVLKTMKVKKG